MKWSKMKVPSINLIRFKYDYFSMATLSRALNEIEITHLCNSN